MGFGIGPFKLDNPLDMVKDMTKGWLDKITNFTNTLQELLKNPTDLGALASLGMQAAAISASVAAATSTGGMGNVLLDQAKKTILDKVKNQIVPPQVQSILEQTGLFKDGIPGLGN